MNSFNKQGVYGKQNKKQLITKYSKIGIIVLCALVLAYSAFYTLKVKVFDKRAGAIPGNGTVAAQQKDQKVNVVRAIVQIKPGSETNKTDYEIVEVPASLVPDNAIKSTQEMEGKRIQNTLQPKEFVLTTDLINSDAWYEDTDRLIEHTFADGALPESVIDNSVIDIKLFLQGTDDKFVVSKTTVVKRTNNTLVLYLDTTEQENIKEAAAEGLLFVTKYLDVTQPPNPVTYRSSGKTAQLPQNNNFTNTPNMQ